MSGRAGDRPGVTPITVVRRAQAERDDHHGGAWKIAYADFMTAMMALFLVLWLVNASSEETRAAVASYFNPIELTDRSARPRGLHDPRPGARPERSGGSPDADEARGGGPGTSPGEAGVEADRAVGASPRAGTAPPPERVRVGAPDATDRAGPQSGAAGGQAHRDPFSPDYWSRTAGEVALDAVLLSDEPGEGTPDAVRAAVDAVPPVDAPAGEPLIPSGSDPAAPEGSDAANIAAEGSGDAPGVSGGIEALASEVAAELIERGQAASIEVLALPGEVVIRLADDPGRAMFALGSSEPAAGLAGDIARVAAVLRDRPGRVAVHGHTDARPFRGDPEGNWRLSAERAEVARRLLVGAGLPRARVVGVVAHADGSPREGLSPTAEGNRRIELRLRPDGEERR